MLVHAYTIYDCKALIYSPPFFAGTHGLATRMVADAANDLSSNLGRHPADFTLYCIGTFDDASSRLLPFDVREHVSDVLPLVRSNAQRDFFTESAPKPNSNGEVKSNG